MTDLDVYATLAVRIYYRNSIELLIVRLVPAQCLPQEVLVGRAIGTGTAASRHPNFAQDGSPC